MNHTIKKPQQVDEIISPCKFCRKGKGEIIEPILNGTLYFYRVFCDVCSACGPYANTAKGAVRRWNGSLRGVRGLKIKDVHILI